MSSNNLSIAVSLTAQQLKVLENGRCRAEYPVSTSRYGPGERLGSEGTPRGRHIVRACIGRDQPPGAVFAARRPTGETYSDELARKNPERDWILTRILWLSGTEPGRNRLGNVDSMRRFIYIHGTPDSEPMGVPRSIGCIRMRNGAVIKLFDLIEPGTSVDIQP